MTSTTLLDPLSHGRHAAAAEYLRLAKEASHATGTEFARLESARRRAERRLALMIYKGGAIEHGRLVLSVDTFGDLVVRQAGRKANGRGAKS